MSTFASSCNEDERFGPDYFERGFELGISWYQDYRWMPQRSHAEARAFLDAMAVNGGRPTVVDYGCAKGFFVRALREQGIEATGYDVSSYALACADPAVAPHVFPVDRAAGAASSDLGFCKDVLEHCRGGELAASLGRMRGLARRWLLVVPLATDGRYRIAEYEIDQTHVIREGEVWWWRQCQRAGFRVRAVSYRVPGLKDRWQMVCDTGNLFLWIDS